MLAIQFARVNLRNNIRSIIVRVKLFLAMKSVLMYHIDDFGVNSHLIKREAILVGVPRSSA